MKKKKILLLSDDIRLHSGVGNMAKSIVMGTVHKYDWVQLGGAINHPEAGKVVDISEDIQKQTGVEDAKVLVYPVSGYGNRDVLRAVLEREEPDMIVHFTDPRFWEYLYSMEHEIRQSIPIGYINIWDDLPYPHWNENAYESCDVLMAISKQTYNINNQVCQRKPRVEGKDLFYTPHGIDESKYYPINPDDTEFKNFKLKACGGRDYDFIAFFNSRNIRRKGTSDLLAAFKYFKDTLPEDKQERVAIVLHTDPIDNNGTDLPAVANALDDKMHVIFSNNKLPEEGLNYLYNMADVTCCPSSAEGFGLSHMESMMSGTPTIATVCGGLQDQMGFRNKDGNFLELKDFNVETPTNSTGLMGEQHGPWTYPLWPNLSLQGSPLTPYIYDSRPTIQDITTALKFWYDAGAEERKRCGAIGRDWGIENGFTKKNMSDSTAIAIDACLDNFEPRERFTIIDTSKPKQKYPSGDIKQ